MLREIIATNNVQCITMQKIEKGILNKNVYIRNNVQYSAELCTYVENNQ